MQRGATLVLGLGLLTCIGCAGEPKQLDPRTPPSRTPPAVSLPAQPPAEGLSRVVLDTTDEPMKVTASAGFTFVPPGAQMAPTRTGELCVTPCVVDLPPGRYKLFMESADGSFARSDSDELTVQPGTNFYRRAPGKTEPRQWLPVVPIMLEILGAVAVGTGLIIASPGDKSGSQGNATTGLIIAGGGVGLMIVGGVLHYDISRGAIQEGATTYWNEP